MKTLNFIYQGMTIRQIGEEVPIPRRGERVYLTGKPFGFTGHNAGKVVTCRFAVDQVTYHYDDLYDQMGHLSVLIDIYISGPMPVEEDQYGKVAYGL